MPPLPKHTKTLAMPRSWFSSIDVPLRLVATVLAGSVRGSRTARGLLLGIIRQKSGVERLGNGAIGVSDEGRPFGHQPHPSRDGR